MENKPHALTVERENPFEYGVTVVYSDGFHFKQNKNKF